MRIAMCRFKYLKAAIFEPAAASDESNKQPFIRARLALFDQPLFKQTAALYLSGSKLPLTSTSFLSS
jgi:hypothetical protein